ncbi:hypothetical protein FQN60_007821 [Etheostoma spectabile]|uniref:Uncharacterized protein n=1 Tax=Etheostoma spectabile TaxID=54343 RepID=A0A5J5CV47_9PERO|nr:hypothetical protein FQN60_007821 [Etheostoma spectabile]
MMIMMMMLMTTMMMMMMMMMIHLKTISRGGADLQGAPQRGEMLTIQVKNTMLHLNGQNLRLAAKNGRSSKTPGLHLSATHGKETAGQLVVCSPTREGTAQSVVLLPEAPRPDADREAQSQPVRRPLKLTPLELPEEVREAQRQKLLFIQQEAKPASCRLDVTANEPRTRKVKSCVRQRLVKAPAGPSVSTEPLKAQKQNPSLRPQLTRSVPVEHNGRWPLEDVVCRGTPAPMCSKPAPPLLSLRVKALAARGAEVARQNPSTLQEEVGKRRLRLQRAQCLVEDQCNSNTPTGGLCADKGKPAQGVQSKGQRAERERAPRVLPHPGKGIKEPPAASWDHGRVSQQTARCTLNQKPTEGGSGEHTLNGVKTSASKGSRAGCRSKGFDTSTDTLRLVPE